MTERAEGARKLLQEPTLRPRGKAMTKTPDRFVVVSVPGAGISPDGEAVVAVVADEMGNKLELVLPYVQIEEVLSAFAEASRKAFDKRRSLGTVDKNTPLGDIPPSKLIGFQFAVADNRTSMSIRLLTANGRFDIDLAPDQVRQFAEATARNAAWMASAPKVKGN